MFLLVVLIVSVLYAFSRHAKKHNLAKRTERKKQADELITVILPIINSDK